MKVFKYSAFGRENVIVLDKVARVYMGEDKGWINLVGVESSVEVGKETAERLVKVMEEGVNDDY